MKLSSAMVPFEGDTVCGFVVVGDSKSEALSVAEIALAHYETPGPKGSVDLDMSLSPSGEYSFALRFGAAGTVEVSDVNPVEFDPMLAALPASPGFFICLGALHGNEVQLIKSSTFFLVKHDLTLMGKPVVLPFKPVNWEKLKAEFDASI